MTTYKDKLIDAWREIASQTPEYKIIPWSDVTSRFYNKHPEAISHEQPFITRHTPYSAITSVNKEEQLPLLGHGVRLRGIPTHPNEDYIVEHIGSASGELLYTISLNNNPITALKEWIDSLWKIGALEINPPPHNEALAILIKHLDSNDVPFEYPKYIDGKAAAWTSILEAMKEYKNT